MILYLCTCICICIFSWGVVTPLRSVGRRTRLESGYLVTRPASHTCQYEYPPLLHSVLRNAHLQGAPGMNSTYIGWGRGGMNTLPTPW